MRVFSASQRLGALCLLALVGILGIQPVAAEAPANQQDRDAASVSGNTFRVFSHREGLVGHTTANGHVIQPNDMFVALPCFCVLSSKGGDKYQVRIEYNGASVTVPVWDVGPWNTDDNYWDPEQDRTWSGLPRGEPAAEAAYLDGYNDGQDGRGRNVQSPAGMDIGDGAFAALGMTTSDWVDVTFLWLERSHESVLAQVPALPKEFSDIQTVWWDERPPLDPVDSVRDERYSYISETGHNVPNQILDYWYAHGGWKTFGLPISELYRQIADDGTIEFVQLFERSILTLQWPGAGGDPSVGAKSLGYDTYIDPAAKKPVKPFPADDWAVYFPETGHSLAGGFRKYWNAHGGVEVFGKPLSEEWSTTSRDSQPVVMQVFERARLEWWPNNTGYAERDDITLGLLTVEQLQRAGWLEQPE